MRRALLAFCALVMASPAWAQFRFVAYGDTTYSLPRDHQRNLRLIEAINSERPAFAIHVGDFKGYTSCSDEAYLEQRARFSRHSHPVLLTPGDNDWTDCWGEEAGGFDPLDRLAAVRRLFFGGEGSGGRPLLLERQEGFPENSRWTHGNVLFATVHAVGPHNNLVIRDRRLALDAIDRSDAGERWIRAAFRAARDARSAALVLAFHVDPWVIGAPIYEGGPLDWLRRTIGEEASGFDGQVLLIHGDSHRLIVDHPYRRADIDSGTTTGMNVTRLQVPGWPDHRAVRVDVDVSRPEVFGFRAIVAPEERIGAPR